MSVDRWDLCILAGMALVAVGCGLWSLTLGLVVAGTELVVLGLFGARYLATRPTPSHEPRAREG